MLIPTLAYGGHKSEFFTKLQNKFEFANITRPEAAEL